MGRSREDLNLQTILDDPWPAEFLQIDCVTFASLRYASVIPSYQFLSPQNKLATLLPGGLWPEQGK